MNRQFKWHAPALAVPLFLLALSAAQGSVIYFGQLDRFTGPADLDLAGIFPYAVNITSEGSPNSRTVSGLAFVRDPLVPGFSIAAQNAQNNWGARPEYGGTADDNALEEITWDIRWSAQPNQVNVNIAVEKGATYKLQLIFSEGWWHNPGERTFNIVVEGQLAVDAFDILETAGGWSGNPNAGAVYTYLFRATDGNLDIDLVPGGTAGDRNPLINAITLEHVIPEPASLTLVALGCLAAAWRRRRA